VHAAPSLAQVDAPTDVGRLKQHLKDTFSTFNAGLERIYATQSCWTIPDAMLRDAVKRVVKNDVMQPYQEFLRRSAWVGQGRCWAGEGRPGSSSNLQEASQKGDKPAGGLARWWGIFEVGAGQACLSDQRLAAARALTGFMQFAGCCTPLQVCGRAVHNYACQVY
jgi:hypothetical protein